MQDFEDQEDVYLHLIISSQLSRLCFFEKKIFDVFICFFFVVVFLFCFFFSVKGC